MRRPDSMTTLTWAASQVNFDDPDIVMTPPTKRTITMVDVVVYHYFGIMPCDLDVFPSNAEVDRLLPGAERLQMWARATFVPDADGNVSHHVALEQHEKDGVNPYMLQPAVAAINSAYALLRDVTILQQKNDKLLSVLELQVDSMISKLEEHAQNGKCSHAKLEKGKLAARQWKADKMKDISLDLDKKQEAAVIAVEAAAREILQLWLLVREKLEQTLNRSGAAMQLQDTVQDSQAEYNAEMTDLAECFESDMIAELDANLAMMSLDDEACSEPTYALNS